MASMIVHGFSVHGVVIGTCRADASGWRVEVWRSQSEGAHRLFDAWDNTRVFPTEAALLAAIDAYLGPEKVAELEQQVAEGKAQEAEEYAQAQAAAEARTFIGVHYDAARPLKETAKLIARDLQAAMGAGHLPRNVYRVTAKGASTIVIWMWGRDDTTEAAIEALLKPYKRCDAEPWVLGSGRDDRWHFAWKFEEPRVFSVKEERSHEQARRRGDIRVDTWCEEWEATRAVLYLRDTGRIPTGHGNAEYSSC